MSARRKTAWSIAPALIVASVAHAAPATAAATQEVDATCDGVQVQLGGFTTKPAVAAVPGTPAYDETVVDQEAYDETVVDQEAYSETIVTQEAYSETIVVQEAYDETVVVQEAYSETVVVQEAYSETIILQPAVAEVTSTEYQWVRGSGQQQQFTWSPQIPQPSGPWSATGQSRTVVLQPAQPAVTQVINHPAVTQVVNHPAVSQVIEHDAVTELVEHDAVTEVVEHDAVTHVVNHDAVTRVVSHDAVTHVVHHAEIPGVDGQAADERPNTVTVAAGAEIIASAAFGETFTGLFAVPTDGTTVWTVTATGWDGSGDQSTGTVGPCGTAAPAAVQVKDAQVADTAADDRGALPETGGASSSLLALGLPAVLAGIAAVLLGRRRIV